MSTDPDLELGAIAARDVVDDGGIRRDQYGRYMLFGQPHTRVSTVLDELDNKAALAPWHAAMAIGGLFTDIELMAAARELWTEHGNDPWYAGASSKAAAKILVEKAAKRGGSKKAADEGHTCHALSATLDAGGTPVCPSPHHERWLEGYVNALINAGITVDPAYIEQIVVLDEFVVAGMFDRGVCHVPGFDVPLLGDVKTGTTLEWNQHTIPMQLGAYTHADSIVIQGEADDGSQDARLELPLVSREWALVIHAPFDRPGEVNFHIVDVGAGWEAFRIAAAAREWHRGPGGAWQPLPGQLEQQLRESLDAVQKPQLALVPTSPPDDELRTWLQQRIDTVGANPKARARLSTAWPKEIPPLRTSDGHTQEQLGVIEAVLDRIEAEFSFPFGPPRPGDSSKDAAHWLQRLLHVFPNSTLQGAQEP